MRHNKSEVYLHFVWTTEGRQPLLTERLERAVYRCMEAQAAKLVCVVLALGGMTDHVHLVLRLPTRLSIARLTKQVKGVSSALANDLDQHTKHFRWQEGYGVFSLSRPHLKKVIHMFRSRSSAMPKGDCGTIGKSRTPTLNWMNWRLSLIDPLFASAGRLAEGPRAKLSMPGALPGRFFTPVHVNAVTPQAIWDTRAGKTICEQTLLDRLAQADIVFVGEQHDDPATHALELRLLQGLHQRAGARLTLAMEMWERDVQPSLNDYLAARMDEAAFLKAARPWSNYRTDYRPLVEYAKAAAHPRCRVQRPAGPRFPGRARGAGWP